MEETNQNIPLSDTCTSMTGHEPDETGKCKICGALNVAKRVDLPTAETKKDVGRPKIVTAEIIERLESILKIGGTIEEATSYAGISARTYYNYLAEDGDFCTKMEAAQHFADIASKQVIINSILADKDLDRQLTNARYWLDRHEFKDQKGGVTVNTQVNTGLTREQIETRFREIAEEAAAGVGSPDATGTTTTQGTTIDLRQDAPKAMGSGYGDQSH